jgi:hypothetical protein
MAVDPGMPIVALRTTPLIPKREKCWRNDFATLPRLNGPDIRHHFCFCASSGLFRRLATGINGALPVKGQYNLSYRMRSPGDRRSLDSSARPLARRGHTLHWLSGAKSDIERRHGRADVPAPRRCAACRCVGSADEHVYAAISAPAASSRSAALQARLRRSRQAAAPLSAAPLHPAFVAAADRDL